MGSFKENRTLSILWDKLQSLLGYSGVSNPLLANTTIDEPLTLYVETTGNDLNPGTADRPFKTIQKAVDWLVGVTIRAPIEIKVGLGSHNGFVMPALILQPLATDGTLHGVTITGTLVTPTLTSGTTSGTSTSSSAGVMNDTGQNWTVNELKGKYLLLPTGTYIPIVSNTATSITFSTNLLANGAYSIVELGSTILRTATRYGTVQAPGTANFCVVMQAFQAYTGAAFLIRRLALDAGTGTAIDCRNQGSYVQFTNCTSLNGSTLAVSGGAVTLTACHFNNTYNNAIGVAVNGNCLVSATASFWDGNSGGMALSANTGAVMNVFIGGVFNGYGVVISPSASSFVTGKISATTLYGVTNCGSIVRNNGCPVVVDLGVTAASGNTTGIELTKGGSVRISSATALGASTEISLDGVAYTLAAMRANSPKLITNTYGSIVYE